MSSKHARVSIRSVATPVAMSLAVVLAACSTAGSAGPSSNVALGSLAATINPEATPTAAAATSPEASLDGGGGQPTPGAIDPCTLLTAAEASTLMGKTLGAGVSADLGPDRVCTFKSGLSEVKLILAPPAPDAATAQAYWDQERAQAPAGVTIKDLALFDRSAYIDGTSAGAPVSAMFVIDGQYFFDLYCGFPACGETASVTSAQLIVGRLP